MNLFFFCHTGIRDPSIYCPLRVLAMNSNPDSRALGLPPHAAEVLSTSM